MPLFLQLFIKATSKSLKIYLQNTNSCFPPSPLVPLVKPPSPFTRPNAVARLLTPRSHTRLSCRPRLAMGMKLHLVFPLLLCFLAVLRVKSKICIMAHKILQKGQLEVGPTKFFEINLKSSLCPSQDLGTSALL